MGEQPAGDPGRVVEILTDPAAVALRGAELFLQAALAATRARGRFAAALSGGATPRLLYGLLARQPFVSAVPWAEVHLFWSDERCVSPDDPRSNFRLAREAFLSTVPIPPTHVHRLHGEAEDADAEARAYEVVLRGLGDGPAPAAHGQGNDAAPAALAAPLLDLVLLGLGPDGHTASLFPARPTLREEHRLAVADDVPGVGRRLTLTVPAINSARHIVFLAVGREKAAVVARVLRGPAGAERLPAQLVAPRHGRLTWLLDEEAAAALHRAR